MQRGRVWVNDTPRRPGGEFIPGYGGPGAMGGDAAGMMQGSGGYDVPGGGYDTGGGGYDMAGGGYDMPGGGYGMGGGSYGCYGPPGGMMGPGMAGGMGQGMMAPGMMQPGMGHPAGMMGGSGPGGLGPGGLGPGGSGPGGLGPGGSGRSGRIMGPRGAPGGMMAPPRGQPPPPGAAMFGGPRQYMDRPPFPPAPDSMMGPGPDSRLDTRLSVASSSGMQGPAAAAAAAVPDLPGVNRPAKKQERGNDYCQHFVDTGVRPQNFLRDSVLEDRYEDYPQLQKLIQLKDKQVRDHTTPPYALRADLKKLALSKEVFGTKFDVILIDPPWEEYVRRAPGFVSDTDFWSWQEIQALDIGAVAEVPSFVFLWCGSAEGLDAGRHCLRKWGYKRAEDICWIKTNTQHKSRKYLIPTYQQEGSMLVHTKEHCLMGIRGSVKRGLDGHLIHTNVDTDVIVSEEPPLGSTEKPEELYDIIERFCAGRRRLELFGEDRNIRQGWVTVGRAITQSTFRPQAYLHHFRNEDGVPYDEHRGRPPPGVPVLVPSTAEIEELRPRSPPHHHGGGGRGRGR
ncbi:hypothetical protein OEZ86_007775 [Tetradesmus obliquus]|nr:hypothetical protein OEZ86_007775 [Tetradesmus obliquus]